MNQYKWPQLQGGHSLTPPPTRTIAERIDDRIKELELRVAQHAHELSELTALRRALAELTK